MIAESLTVETHRLVNAGIVARKACGRTTRRIAWRSDMPLEIAASRWPDGIPRMPARYVSP